MRLIDADLGGQKIDEALAVWTLAMANAERQEIAFVDRKQRLCKAVKKFLDSLPTVEVPDAPPPCYVEDKQAGGCCWQCYDGDDEPIEKCKACPLCYVDKQRRGTE